MSRQHLAKELAPALKAARESKGVTLKSVAFRLGLQGPTQVWRWENGQAFPAERRYVEYYANELGGGQELLALYDRLLATGSDNGVNRRGLVVGGDYIVNSYEIVQILPDVPGARMREISIREIMALRNGVSAWRGSTKAHGIETDDGSMTTQVLTSGKGTLVTSLSLPTRHTPLPGRVYITELLFPEDLLKDELTRFTILRTYPTDFAKLTQKNSLCALRIPPVKTPVEHATLTVCFPATCQPKKVWHYEDLPDSLAPGTWSESSKLTIDNAGTATFTWDNLVRGYCYGLAWIW